MVLGKVYPLSPPKRLGLILPVGLHPEGPGDSASKARVVDSRNSRRLQWGTVARRRAPPWSWPYVQLANEGSPIPQYQDAFERAVQDTAQSRVWTQKWARRSAMEHVRLS